MRFSYASIDGVGCSLRKCSRDCSTGAERVRTTSLALFVQCLYFLLKSLRPVLRGIRGPENQTQLARINSFWDAKPANLCSVVRFNPRRSAAPPFPAIRPEAALKASIITVRSALWKVQAEAEAVRQQETMSSPIGASNSSPCEIMTARSMKFANSLTLPFHEQFVSVCINSSGTHLICFRIFRDSLSRFLANDSS